jgi:hypothetical protein
LISPVEVTKWFLPLWGLYVSTASRYEGTTRFPLFHFGSCGILNAAPPAVLVQRSRFNGVRSMFPESFSSLSKVSSSFPGPSSGPEPCPYYVLTHFPIELHLRTSSCKASSITAVFRFTAFPYLCLCKRLVSHGLGPLVQANSFSPRRQ